MNPTTKPGEADLTALRAAFRPMDIEQPWTTEHSRTYPQQAAKIINAARAALGTAPATHVPDLPELWHAANAVVHMLPQIDEPRTSRLYAALRDAGVQPVPASEPVAWTLTEELQRRETTCRAHLWFVNPKNSAWTALYDHPAPAPATQADAAGAGQEAAAVQAVGAWQDIATAPKDGTDVLLSNGVVVAEGHWLHDEGGTTEFRDMDGRYTGQDDQDGFIGWIDWSGGMIPAPTVWQQKPAPPAALCPPVGGGGTRA